MDLKKKKEILYYYISSVSNLDMNELEINIDFNLVREKLVTLFPYTTLF